MLTLQFGQCGNQLGRTLFSKVSDDIDSKKTGVPHNANFSYVEEAFDTWFTGFTRNGQRLARAVLIDTEDKVVDKITDNQTSLWTYCTRNVISQSSGGSGNNWAHGYMEKGPTLSESVMNMIRYEVEKVDCLETFLLLLSSAGGTGSGIGSYIAESLREEYNTKTILSTVVLPFSFGETCMQNYNTVLTLAKVQDHADATFLIENDWIYNTFKNSSKELTVKLEDINEVISENLCSSFQPISSAKYSPNLLIMKLVSQPCYKFATVMSVPHPSMELLEHVLSNTWQLYINRLKRTLKSYSSPSEISKQMKKNSSCASSPVSCSYSCSVSNILITRGTVKSQDSPITNEFCDKWLYTEWAAIDPFTHLHQQRHILNRNKVATLITNNSNISQPINTLLQKAWTSYTHSAFLHQYKQFGLEENDLLCSFAKVECLLNNYKELGNVSGYKKL